MGQTVAVSDAGNTGKQSFAFDWGSPEDAANAQKELEAQAVRLLAAQSSAASSSTAKKAPRGNAPRHGANASGSQDCIAGKTQASGACR